MLGMYPSGGEYSRQTTKASAMIKYLITWAEMLINNFHRLSSVTVTASTVPVSITNCILIDYSDHL